MAETLAPVVHSPPNHLLRIDAVYLFISTDDQGEGLCAAPIPDGLGPMPGGVGLMPLVAADPARLSALKPIAQQLSNLTGKTIRLIKLSRRDELDLITPQS